MKIMLYHGDYPDGKIFTCKKDMDEAYRQGAVEAPWLVGINPIKEEVIIAKNVPIQPTAEAPEVKYCECGCGTPVKSRFVQGHSWRATKHGNRTHGKPPDKGGIK